MNAQQIFRFIFAGNATFTLQAVDSGTHYTYQVRQGRPWRTGPNPPFFAKLLVAPDTYAYLGVLEPRRLRPTEHSRVGSQSPGFKALDWFMRELARTAAHLEPAKVIFRHEGRCGRCARELTTPASVDTGFGPDCAERLGVPHEEHYRPVSSPDASAERMRLAAITCPACHGKLGAEGWCIDCHAPRVGGSMQQVLAELRAARAGDESSEQA